MRLSCDAVYFRSSETLVGDLECPQQMKQELASKGVHCMFSYKRLEAKIAWPTGQL